MKTITTIATSTKEARIVENDWHYIVLATMNKGTNTSSYFSGMTWKTKTWPIRRIKKWLEL